MMLYKLLSRSDRRRFDSVVITLRNEGAIRPLIEQLGVPVHKLGMRPGSVPSPRVLIELANLARKIQPDIVQGWMYHGNIAAQYAGFFSGRTPVCWNIRHSLYSLSYEKKNTAAVIKLCGLLSRSPEKIIYNARESVHLHETIGFRQEKSVVIPNGFDTDLFTPNLISAAAMRSELNLTPDAVLIGLIARYHPMKDHENFLRAAALLVDNGVNAHFILAGKEVDETNRAIGQIIDSSGLGDRVHLLGERSDVPYITQSLDIATSSSYSEAFPNVVGEAMACGVPCVVTDVGDSAWIVGPTGRVVPPRNPQAMSEAWLELIRMGADGRRDLGRMARQRICDDFSLDAVVQQYESLYSQLATTKG